MSLVAITSSQIDKMTDKKAVNFTGNLNPWCRFRTLENHA